VRHWRTATTLGLIAIACVLGVWLAGGRGSPPSTEDDDLGRQPVTCPAAGERTMVALVFGQSQAANVVREQFVGGGQVFNYFRGRCYAATDPLLGTGGDGGNVWTLIGTELVQQKQFDAVVLVTIAIGGTNIDQWAPDGKMHARLMRAVDAVGPAFSYTHVFIQQGEADLLDHTTGEDYFRRFAEVITALRRSGVDAPIFVAIESGYCDGRWLPPKSDNPIAEAQRQVIAAHEGVYFGPDMDAAINASDRYDGCHMSGAGARKLSGLWTAAIAAPVPGRPRDP
jgi:lysophospholipase L1-like esterase